MDSMTPDNPDHSPNRIACERCGKQGKKTFTTITPDGQLDPRRLCESCHRRHYSGESHRAQEVMDEMLKQHLLRRWPRPPET
jgi:hypothetical protein